MLISTVEETLHAGCPDGVTGEALQQLVDELFLASDKKDWDALESLIPSATVLAPSANLPAAAIERGAVCTGRRSLVLMGVILGALIVLVRLYYTDRVPTLSKRVEVVRQALLGDFPQYSAAIGRLTLAVRVHNSRQVLSLHMAAASVPLARQFVDRFASLLMDPELQPLGCDETPVGICSIRELSYNEALPLRKQIIAGLLASERSVFVLDLTRFPSVRAAADELNTLAGGFLDDSHAVLRDAETGRRVRASDAIVLLLSDLGGGDYVGDVQRAFASGWHRAEQRVLDERMRAAGWADRTVHRLRETVVLREDVQ